KVSAVAQDTVDDRTWPCGTTSDISGDRRDSGGAWVEAQLPADLARRLIDVRDKRAGLSTNHAGLKVNDARIGRHVENNSAPQRYTLTVVRGAAAPLGDRDAITGGGRDDTLQLFLTAGR